MLKSRMNLALAAMMGILLITVAPALAQVVVPATPDTTIHVGSLLDDLLKEYQTLIGTVVAGVITWAAAKFTGIHLKKEARDAIETTANNLAGNFLAKYDTLDGVKVDVHNAEIAKIANNNLYRVEDSLKKFGLGVEDLKKRVVEKIGILTAGGVTPVVDMTAVPAPKPPGV